MNASDIFFNDHPLRTTLLNGDINNSTVDFSPHMRVFLNGIPNSEFNTDTHLIETRPAAPLGGIYESLFKLNVKKRNDSNTILSTLDVLRSQLPAGRVVQFHSNTHESGRRKGFSKVLKGVMANIVDEENLGDHLGAESYTVDGISKHINSKYLGLSNPYPISPGTMINNHGTVSNAVHTFLNAADSVAGPY